ncbi:MAG: ABC transporter ATP-binding protein [bacterium]
MSERPILSVKNLSVSFAARDGKISAVEKLSYELARGESLGIVGESGSGKSVSCNALLGLLPKPAAMVTSGEAWFSNSNLLKIDEKAMRRIRGKAISMVFQDPMSSMNPYLRVGQQVMEPLRLHTHATVREARTKAIELLEEVGINNAARRFHQYPHEFSGGMRQRAMIAMALITNPRILIADEPTSALDVTVQAQILDLLDAMQRQRGISLILVSHDLDVVRRVTDQVIVMRKGVAVEHGQTGSVLSSPKHGYTQKLLAAVPRTAKPESFRFSTLNAPICLETEGISVTYPLDDKTFRAVDDVGFQVHDGEVLGIVGESGCGKTTLSNAIVRLVSMDTGKVFLDKEPLHELTASSLKPYRKQMQMVFQNPNASLDPRMTAHDIIAEPLQLHRLTHGVRATTAEVIELMMSVGLQPEWANKYPHEFSGGQCQRVAIARALAVRPRLLIADEPVSALDVTIQSQILDLLLNLVKQNGLSMIFISHDLAVVRFMSDRVAVMKNGCVIEIGKTETVYAEPQHAYTRQLVRLGMNKNEFN